MKKIALLSFLAIFIPSYAHAHFDVHSPRVEKGIAEVESKNTFGFDDEDTRQHVIELKYGLTDWWALALEGEWEEENSSGYAYTATAIDNYFQFFEPGEYWLDTGAILEYEFSHESQHPNKVEGTLLLEKQAGRFVNTANIIVEKEVGRYHEASTEFGLSWKTGYLYQPEVNPGIEYYAEFGEIKHTGDFDSQDHRFGPVIFGSFYPGLKYDLGWLFGLSDSSVDNTLKFNIEYEFPI
jgi:hypothetical protein